MKGRPMRTWVITMEGTPAALSKIDDAFDDLFYNATMEIPNIEGESVVCRGWKGLVEFCAAIVAEDEARKKR